MKYTTSLILVVTILLTTGFRIFHTLENNMGGNWRNNGGTVYLFQSGTMAIRSSGRAYASYQVLDNETLRYRQNNTEWIVKVKFPTATTMIWYRGQTDELRDWMTFSKFSDQELAEEESRRLQARMDATFAAEVQKQKEQAANLKEAERIWNEIKQEEWQKKADSIISGAFRWLRDDKGNRYYIPANEETSFCLQAQIEWVQRRLFVN